ncbi:MAG: zeta toxin family protein [Elusimicrobiota bacterium]|jgi:predicted ABC-type ATPase|nr:zeta toxin family protein [Elusimicrobiota bacterium]
MQKTFYILAGANGTGKSTVARTLLKEENLCFLNADDIAAKITPSNIESAKISAGKKVFEKLNELFIKKVSFAMESTLSGATHLKIIQRAKDLNYKIIIIYSFVDNPQICINRIKIRVLSGGHNIPEEDVIRRFSRSKNNFWHKYKQLANEWMLFYNGGKVYHLVAKAKDGDTVVLNEILLKEFLKDIKK